MGSIAAGPAATWSGDARPAILGPFGPAQLTCLRSWRARGWKPIFLHVLETRRPLFIRRLASAYLPLEPDALAGGEAAPRIGEFLAGCRATSLTCLSYDYAIWLREHRDALPPSLALWIPDAEMMRWLRSKRLQIEIAERVGMPVLPTYHCDQPAPPEIPREHFPLVVRPDDESTVSPSFKAVLVADRAELSHLLSGLERLSRPLLAQPYRAGPNLVVHGARHRSGRTLGHVAFLVDRKSNGVTLTMQPASIPAGLAERCERFCDAMGFIGNYHFDFLLDSQHQRWCFLEINGRLGGTTGKAFVCGYDEPLAMALAHSERMDIRDYVPALSVGRVVTNKRALIKTLFRTLNPTNAALEYPILPWRKRWQDLVPGLWRWCDEILLPGALLSSISYLSQAVPSMRKELKKRQIVMTVDR